MLGVKEFFKYFWKYFKSKDCMVKKIMFRVWMITAPIALLVLFMGDGFEGESIGTKILYFFGYLIFFLGPWVPIFGIVLGYRIAKFKKDFDKYSYNDLVNKKEYYREFLINYSPAVLSYIDDFNVEEKDIVATVLNLELKGYLKIKADKIEVISNDESKLDLNEKYVLKTIQNGMFKPEFMLSEFRQCTYSDVNRKKLICTGDVRKKGIIKSFLKWSLIAYAFSWLIELVYKTLEYIDFGIVDMFLMIIAVPIGIPFLIAIILYPTAAISYCITAYIQACTETTIYRTNEAEKINENIEGLKNFLKDFSLLAEREREEIELWDRYLIYSVMLGQNREIVKDFEKYYNL